MYGMETKLSVHLLMLCAVLRFAVHPWNGFNYPKKNVFELLLMVWVVSPPPRVSLPSPSWKFRPKETFCFVLAIAPGTLALSAGSSHGFFFIDSSPATNLGCQNEKMTWTLRKIRKFSVSVLLVVNKHRLFLKYPFPFTYINIHYRFFCMESKVEDHWLYSFYKMYSFKAVYATNNSMRWFSCDLGSGSSLASWHVWEFLSEDSTPLCSTK